MSEFADVEPMVEETISEHHVFPLVEVLLKRLVILFSTVIFDQQGVKHSLRNLDVLVGLNHHT